MITILLVQSSPDGSVGEGREGGKYLPQPVSCRRDRPSPTATDQLVPPSFRADVDWGG